MVARTRLMAIRYMKARRARPASIRRRSKKARALRSNSKANSKMSPLSLGVIAHVSARYGICAEPGVSNSEQHMGCRSAMNSRLSRESVQKVRS
jgi:hypothetical protein